MAVRVGEVEHVTVRDVIMTVVLTWGDIKRINRDLKAIPDEDTDAQLCIADRELLAHVVAVEGIEDESGQPLTKLTQELLDDLPPAFVQDALQAMLEVGKQTQQADGQGNA